MEEEVGAFPSTRCECQVSHSAPVLLPGDAAECGGRIVAYRGATFVDPLPLGPPEVEFGWTSPPISFLAVKSSLGPRAWTGLTGADSFYHCRGTWDGQLFQVSEPLLPFSEDEIGRRMSERNYGQPESLTFSLSQKEAEVISHSIPPGLEDEILGVAAPSNPFSSGSWGFLVWIHHMTPAWAKFSDAISSPSVAIVPVLSAATVEDK